MLVKTAQDIAADHKLPKISVISGIGTYTGNQIVYIFKGNYDPQTKNCTFIMHRFG